MHYKLLTIAQQRVESTLDIKENYFLVITGVIMVICSPDEGLTRKWRLANTRVLFRFDGLVNGGRCEPMV